MPKSKRKSARTKRAEDQQKRLKKKITLEELQNALHASIAHSQDELKGNESHLVENIKVPLQTDAGAGCSKWVSERALRDKEKYYSDEQFRERAKLRSKRQYEHCADHKERKKKSSVNKYVSNPEHRNKVQTASVCKYASNQEHRNKVQTASVNKYASSAKHREHLKKASSIKYSNDPEHCEKKKKASVNKYRTNELHRETLKRKSASKYFMDANYRNHKLHAALEKYATDICYRQKNLHRKRQKYSEDRSYRIQKIRKVLNRQSTTDNKKNRNEVQRQLFRKNHFKILKSKKTRYSQKKQEKAGVEKMIERFKQNCKAGPELICAVCKRLCFEKQVKKCFPAKLSANKNLTNRCISDISSHRCTETCAQPCLTTVQLYICHTCHTHLSKGNMPSEAQANSLIAEERHEDFKTLNTLEEQVVSLAIPFGKIVALPRGGQKGIKGGVICVPSNVTETTRVLPRPLTDSDLIAVKLKRKAEYKGHMQYQVIDTSKVQRVLTYLQQNNPHYKDVQLDKSWHILDEHESLNALIDTDTRQNEDLQSSNMNYSEDSDIENQPAIQPDPSEQMRDIGFDSCMQPPDLRTEAQAELHRAIFSIAPAAGNKPVSMFRPGDDDIEAMAFPSLFPTAKNTFHQDREKKLSLTQYFNARLLGADSRFAQSSQYIFFAQYSKEMDQLLSNISIAMRKGGTKTVNGSTVTAQMLANDEEVSKLKRSDIAYHHFDTLRGTPDYWKRTMNDLFAMIRQLGLPTWFCTFSAAELSRWPEVIETIAKQQGKEINFETLDWNEKCDLLRSNPVTAARMFDHRVHEFVTNVLKSNEHPIGEISDYFYRVEYQARGSPHIHCLFFVKDAPELDKTDDATVVEFVNKYISCRLPDQNLDYELHEIVKSVQTHRKTHSKSCKKGKKTCRFNFPRPVAKETFINRPELSDENVQDNDAKKRATASLKELAEMLNGTIDPSTSIDEVIVNAGFSQYQEFQDALKLVATKTEIIMKREVKDVWINGYNPDLLRAWNANMDIQYIMDPYSCVMYILSYISKSEHELGEILQAAQKQLSEKDCTPDLRAQMKRLGSVYFENREVSVQEAVAKTCSLRLKESSRQVVFVATDQNARLSKPLSQIKAQAESESGDKDIWMTSLEDRYKARPKTDGFENMCQATFASEFRVLAKAEAQRGKEKDHVFQLQNNLGYIQKRTRGSNAVIRFAKYSNTNNSEKYHQSLLKLYLPFRQDDQLKPSVFQTFQDFYDQGAVKLGNNANIQPVKLIVEENRNNFEKSNEDLQNAWQQFQDLGVLEDAWAQISPESEALRRDAEDERDQNENDDVLRPEEVPQLQNETPAEPARTLISVEWLGETVRPLLQTMNEMQKGVFYYVRQWCLQSAQGKNPEPFFMHVTGGAGTGKSHLIKCIYNEACKILKNRINPEEVKVLLTAPTGTAAFNIGAFTIHSAFKIPRTAKHTYEPLSNESVNTLQAMLAGLKILIIDEISMVDRKVLAYIHGRLKQIKHKATSDKNALFGGVCVIAVGDFYQLPPVKAKPVCIPDMQFGSDMWNENFEIISLDEIMRQKDDVAFAKTLNILRTKSRSQKLSAVDETTLQGRTNLPNIPQDALHVFSTNKAVDIHNDNMLLRKCEQPIFIEAQDYSKNARSGKVQRLQNPKTGSSDDLSDFLKLGKGARVMLLRNIDVSDGLVNGAFGIVINFEIDQDQSVKTVHVKFDSDKVGKKIQLKNKCVPIEHFESGLSNLRTINRRQFPLKLAWACTIHKVQGMTVKELVYDMSGTFSSGQAYVALSRVTSLDGLYLKNYDQKFVYRSEPVHKAIQEMKPFLGIEKVNIDKEAFTVVHHNVQGLVSKLADIKCNQDVKCVDMFAVTETWLTEKIEDDDIALEGYDVHREDRPGGRGGVCVYTKQRMFARQVQFYSDLEHCALHVSPSNNVSFLVIMMYRPPKRTLEEIVPRLQDLLYMVQQEKSQNVAFVGDFNEDQLKAGHHAITSTFADYGYKQLITESTSQYGSMLDLIYIKTTRTSVASVVPTYYSDHEAVKLSVLL